MQALIDDIETGATRVTTDEVTQWEFESNEAQDEGVRMGYVLEWQGRMLRIRQSLMAIGRPYAFVFEGVPVVMVKRSSGNVDFYHVPA